MTLKDILKNIDEILENQCDEYAYKLIFELEKNIKINQIIKDAAPYFDHKKS